MKEELMSIPIKGLALGILIGLIVGIAVGYAVTPKVDVTPFEEQISELEGQVAELQNDLDNKSAQILDFQAQIDEKDSQISELQSQIETASGQMTALLALISTKNSEIGDLLNQVSELQSQVEELKQLIPPYTRGEWNLVESFQGISGLTTDYFYIGGAELRLNWTWTSSTEEFAGFSIQLYQQGQTVIKDAWSSLQKEGTTRAHNIESANYFLKIIAINLDQWNVTVEVYIPDQTE